jgi:hypothetical protein
MSGQAQGQAAEEEKGTKGRGETAELVARTVQCDVDERQGSDAGFSNFGQDRTRRTLLHSRYLLSV